MMEVITEDIHVGTATLSSFLCFNCSNKLSTSISSNSGLSASINEIKTCIFSIEVQQAWPFQVSLPALPIAVSAQHLLTQKAKTGELNTHR